MAKKNILKFYLFFLVSDSYKRKIRSIVSKIQPKAVYFNLAKKIAKDLGDFNGIHVRLGDFKQWWIKSPTAKEITENISQLWLLKSLW